MALGKGILERLIREALPKRPAASFAVFCAALFAASHAAFADIDNSAIAAGNYGGAPVLSNASTASVPVDNTVSGMAVTTTANDDTDVVAGQVITYTYVVTNTGGQTLTNVSLSESHNGSGPPPVPGAEFLSSDVGVSGDSTDAASNDGVWSVLAPGDSITMTATYTVTQTDVDTLQ
jgi:hypothetical protein